MRGCGGLPKGRRGVGGWKEWEPPSGSATGGKASRRLPVAGFGLTNRAPLGQKGPSCFLPSDLRLHDLRHHFVTKLLENPLVAEETVRRLVGHVDSRMLQRYSHIRVTVADKAMEAIDTPPTCSAPLQNPLQITHQSSPLRQ